MSLTKTQERYLAHFMTGMGVEQIATKFGVRPNTVRRGLEAAYDRIDAHNAREAAFKLGWIHIPGFNPAHVHTFACTDCGERENA